MVIGERFAWGHLQKTGGDATLGMFQLFPRLIVHADPRNVQQKHAPFSSREHEVEGKILVCNLRRLPAWSLSWAQHHSQHRSVRGDGRPVLMPSPQAIAERRHGDLRLADLTGEGRFVIDRWLRTECLADDFIALVSELIDLSASDREQIAGFPRVNALEYDHEIEHWFTPAQVRLIYANNPVWAKLEERVFGDLAMPG
jgi:hypothetical protein